MPGLFVSHAHTDRDLVGNFVDTILRSGCGLSSQIFYSSDAATGVRAGADLNTSVRDAVVDASLVVAIITPTFLSRPFCLAELGAAWSRVGNLFPLVIPGIPRSALDGILADTLVAYLDDGARLDELRDRIGTVVAPVPDTAVWNRCRNQWLGEVKARTLAVLEPAIRLSPRPSPYAWPATGAMRTRHRSFERVALGDPPAPARELVGAIIGALDHLRSPHGVWTHGEDRAFDRVYATSAVLTCLSQYGLSAEHPWMTAGMAFLDGLDPSLDNRAAHLFSLAADRGDDATHLAFLALLRASQVKDSSSPIRGSWLLPQGPGASPSPPPSHWMPPGHSQGAAFHACHIANVLHDVSSPALRGVSHEILLGITEYLSSNFTGESGVLRDAQGRPSYLTLLAYALAPDLGIALPGVWRANTAEMLRGLRADSRLLARCFTLLNVHMLATTIDDEALLDLALEHVMAEIPVIWANRGALLGDARDVAAFGRAMLYGWRTIDPDARSYLAVEINRLAPSPDV